MENAVRTPRAVAEKSGRGVPLAGSSGAPTVRGESKPGEIRGLDVWSFRARLWAIRRLQRAWTLNPGNAIK